VTFADPQVKISKHKKYTRVSIKKDSENLEEIGKTINQDNDQDKSV